MKFNTGAAIEVRLSAAFRAAIGMQQDADIQLWGAELGAGGWLLADYREANGDIRRYAVPPGHVIYVRQLMPQEITQAPQQTGG
jgi:hypothetical protein